MNIFALLGILFFVPIVLFVAYLILSSCLGDRFRASVAGTALTVRQGSYGRTYGRNMGSGMHQGGWENIEMQDMLDEDGPIHRDDRDEH